MGTRTRRLAVATLLALLGHLPLPHVDTYLPLALGLFAAASNFKENGPLYLAVTSGLFVFYAAVAYGVLSIVARARARAADGKVPPPPREPGPSARS